MYWRKAVIHCQATIRDSIRAIDSSLMQIALVVDDTQKLLGTITDGDIRRGILKGVSLDDRATEVMNDSPIVASIHESREDILATMRSKLIRHIPIVDSNGKLINLETLDSIIRPEIRDNYVVIMAGGLGTRLHPLTETCPKPLLKVGNKPLLETIINNFISYGFRKFYISVNYKAEMIMSYFGDGSKWDIEVQYLHENKRMGTAGALSLLPEIPQKPLVIMNGDLLTKVNFTHLLNFHEEHSSLATMCVRDYDFQVPYGVVNIEKHRMLGIKEKPTIRFFVNAGIYILNPEALSYIPEGTFYDMPTLFEALNGNNLETSAFPIREYWLDIGRIADFEKANGEYEEVFQ